MAKKKPIENRHGSLTLVDKFYIEEHGYTSVDDLVLALGKPRQDIQDYVNELAKQYKKKTKPKANALMERHNTKGVISMTAGASQAGDDAKYNGFVTQEAISQARVNGDMESVKRLTERYEAQQKDNRNVLKEYNKNMIHHIIPIGEDDEIY